MSSRKKLFTIGYEGATVASFLEALRTAGVELLVDVRALASSRRPGFTKPALTANLGTIGVDYLHLRGLGTPADGRAAARAGRHDEMRTIFLEHMKEDVAQDELARLADIVRGPRKVCLLCFEADPSHCHRKYVVEALEPLVPFEVEHLFARDEWDKD